MCVPTAGQSCEKQHVDWQREEFNSNEAVCEPEMSASR